MTARVLKRNGDLASPKSRDAEMLNDKSGHPRAYWSNDTTGGVKRITRITIDPATNNGARAGFSLDGMSFGDWLQAYRDMYAAHDTFYRERFRHRCVGFTPLLTRWSARLLKHQRSTAKGRAELREIGRRLSRFAVPSRRR